MAKNIYLYGHHACDAALANPNRTVIKILCTEKVSNKLKLNKSHPKPQIVQPSFFGKILPHDATHQGIVIETKPLPDCYIEDFYDEQNILALDQITDPHNVGAIIRSCIAFGVNMIIVPRDNSVHETALLAKSASGAYEKINICTVTNLSRTLNDMKKEGFWVTGLDGKADSKISDINFSGKNILVLGSEGKGLRRLTAETCDNIVKLPISKNIESLNVSNAASIALYELARG